jgi:hypothetical protein
MRLGVVPDNLLERLALLSGMLPPGIFECWFGERCSAVLVRCDRCGDFQPNAWRCRRCQAMLPCPGDYLRGLVRDFLVACAVGGLLGLGYCLGPLFR